MKHENNMEAPKEIYILQGKDEELGGGWHDHYIDSNTCNCIKYIRADLTELTWKDLKLICEIEDRYWNEEFDGNIKVTMQEYYQEVLRRFLESK